jgi:hypothetical protein
MIYIDFILLTTLLLPIVLRRTLISALLNIATASIDTVQTESTALYDATNYRLKFNELKIYIERYLNDQYDPTDRMIRITDVEQEQNTYIFNSNEDNENIYIWNVGEEDGEDVYLFNDSEIDDIEDFIVEVPVALVFNEDALRRDVDIFRLPGMKYSIQTY